MLEYIVKVLAMLGVGFLVFAIISFLAKRATDKPSAFYVEDEIRKLGYRCENISISHDGLQQKWRFTARLLDI